MEIFQHVSDFVGKVGFLQTIILIFLLDRIGLFKVIYAKIFKKPEVFQHRRKDDDEEHTHRRINDELREANAKLSTVVTELAKFQTEITNIKNIIKHDETKLSDHLIKEQEENIRMAVIEETIKNNREKIDETKVDIQEIFKILGEIKNLMIQHKLQG